MEKTRVGLGQINTKVGDLEGNCSKMLTYIEKARHYGVDILSFPELSIPGYPPEDLLLKPKFIEDNLKNLEKLSIEIGDIFVIVGFVDKKDTNLYNAAALLHNKQIIGVYHKMLLPNYGVFDEKRYFTPGENPIVFNVDSVILGVNICEDIWNEKKGPAKVQAGNGATLIININGSPYHMGKIKERVNIVKKQARENNVFMSYTNLVGGQDELVFDGQSMVVNTKGEVIAQAEPFKEDLLIVDIELETTSEKQHKTALPERKTQSLEPIEEIYKALTTGVKDYVRKNGFEKVVIGLSGGIDSSLVATIAADALGKENVIGVFMPSRYSSKESGEDAGQLTQNMGIKLLTIPVEQIFTVYLTTFEPYFKELKMDVTEENIQARIRGNILMALSNKFNWLVLTTGNKSEMSVGYATLYGDMAGGLAVIKDVYKTFVYKLTEYRNSVSSVIPERILRKSPSAELAPNQKDTDTLPPYEQLDNILKEYIENNKTFAEIVSLGYEREVVKKIVRMVDGNEYKRRQSPPGIKITPKSFGKDRRMPIVNKYSA